MMGIQDSSIHQENQIQKSRDLEPLFPKSKKEEERAVAKVIHLQAIHTIRRVTSGGHFARVFVDGAMGGPYEVHQSLANACRETLASVSKRDPETIHCTLKYCSGRTGLPPHDWDVWTIARSTIQSARRPNHMGPAHSVKISQNSGFAAIVGCHDGATDWRLHPHESFACDMLSDHDEYLNCKDDWEQWYRSTLVYPLRCESWDKLHNPHDILLGFLTFDSLDKSVFADVPCIYEYVDAPGDYGIELDKSEIYHAGGIIADVIATAMMLERRALRRNAQGARGRNNA